jgi:hypothetical protein
LHVPQTLALQVRPAQHCAVVEQNCPPGVQVLQAPPMQLKPAQHCALELHEDP